MENNSLIPSKEEFDILHAIAKTATDSKYFDKLGGMPGILCIALYAKEIGVSPMVALMGGFSNIQGKITMSSELMNTLIRRAGHKIHVVRCDNELCELTGERGDTKEKITVKFTFQEAKAASLVKAGGAWEKWTSDMLFARAVSRLRRRLFPDVATRAYVEGELDEIDIEVPPAETPTIKESRIVETLISADEAYKIEEAVADDSEYRTKLLKHWTEKLNKPISTFDQIPASKLKAIWDSINRRPKPDAPEVL